MKKLVKITIFAVLVCLGVSLFACNNEGYTNPQLPEDYVVDPRGKIKVSMWLRSGPESEIALDNWIKSYTEHYPNVKVRTDIIEWAQFPVQVAAGDIGDVYYTADCDVYNYSGRYRSAMALDSYIENMNIDIQQMYTAVYDLGCYNGLLYMVPSDITQSVFYTNVTTLKAEGLEKPSMDWTWDDFRDYCARLRKVNSDGTYEQVGAYFESNYACGLTFWLGSWGGKWYDTVNKKVHFSSDENVVRGIFELIDLVDKGYASTQNLVGEIGAKHANLEDPQSFGFKYGLHYGILYQDRIELKKEYDILGLEMDVCTLPKTPVISIPGEAFGYMVYSKTKNPDAAATFALFLLTLEGQKAFNNVIGGGIPCTREGIASGVWRIPYPEGTFNYDAFLVYPEAFCACWSECYVPPEISKIINESLMVLVANHLNNKKDYKDALRELEQTANEKWETIYEEVAAL
jgi:ABC-type glycerol-3-phosphate transport system substrate-binding protein